MPNTLPSPPELGLPPKFKQWWASQPDAILACLNAETSVVAHCLPTGSGKSVIYMTAGLLRQGRVAVLTATKALARQLVNDFTSIGLVEVRGKGSFRCKRNHSLSCGQGYCLLSGRRCNDCDYLQQVRRAKDALMVVTNYAFWSTYREAGADLGEFTTLVLDEAHEAAEAVGSAFTVTITRNEVEQVDGSWPPPTRDWGDWSTGLMETTNAVLAGILAEADGRGSAHDCTLYAKHRSLLRGLERIRAGEWVQRRADDAVTWEPYDALDFTSRYLVDAAPLTVLCSATLTEPLVQGLGYVHYDYWSFPHVFPVENRPVLAVKAVGLSARTTDRDYRRWAACIDRLISLHPNQKGIVHTVSYQLAERFFSLTRHQKVCMVHAHNGSEDAVRKFKRARPPAVLVSPCVATGHDFPYDHCRFSVLAKVGFPTLDSPSVVARISRDPDYMPNHAAQFIVQASGRGVRAPDDWCSMYVVDDNFDWFVRQYESYFPSWFLEAVQFVELT